MNIKPCYKSINDDLTFVKQQNAVNAFLAENPRAEIIDLGIGDLKLPPVKAVSRALKKAPALLRAEKRLRGIRPISAILFCAKKFRSIIKKRAKRLCPTRFL